MAEFLSGEGIRLAYDTAGAGDPPIIFVHGWSCDRSYFAPQFEHFAAGHAVAAMDLRGHGAAAGPIQAPAAMTLTFWPVMCSLLPGRPDSAGPCWPATVLGH